MKPTKVIKAIFQEMSSSWKYGCLVVLTSALLYCQGTVHFDFASQAPALSQNFLVCLLLLWLRVSQF